MALNSNMMLGNRPPIAIPGLEEHQPHNSSAPFDPGFSENPEYFTVLLIVMSVVSVLFEGVSTYLMLVDKRPQVYVVKLNLFYHSLY